MSSIYFSTPPSSPKRNIEETEFNIPPSSPKKSRSPSDDIIHDIAQRSIGSPPSIFHRAICPDRPSTSKKKFSLQTTIENIHKSGTFTSDGKTFALDQKIGNGSYADVYSFTGEQPYHNEYHNNQLVIKFFQKEHTYNARSYLKNIQDQYNELLNSIFPIGVAKIININTLLTDGYIIQEKVTSLFNNETASPGHVQQIVQAFSLLKNDKFNRVGTVDLRSSNLGLSKDGNLVLFDFKEDEDDSFAYVQNNLLATFGPENSPVAQELIQSLTWIEDINIFNSTNNNHK